MTRRATRSVGACGPRAEPVRRVKGHGNVGQILTIEGMQRPYPPYIYWIAQYEYDPYGNTILIDDHYYDISGNLVGGACPFDRDNPFRFSTKWFDNETGLGYWGYRYYSPRLGRSISRDPIEETGGLNLYEYVRNSPACLFDTLGRQAVPRGISCQQ